ncbi:HD domain-containing protein [Paenisporosarcina sp.]|uniref:HD domain-containing protein n=1 Tax=Paenisporosarcina sp. TaxID=1932001 RepID=UPI003C72702B
MNTIEKCELLVKDIYNQFDASHDFQHIERVRKNAQIISQEEGAVRTDLIELAVLLHDVSDVKYSGKEGKAKENAILDELGLPLSDRQEIVEIIESVSFSGGHEKEAKTIEAKIVRDADRLDAIGAVGIARTFAYGGAKGRKLYDWSEAARMNMSESEYRSKETSSVTHFYEKLLLLKDLMVTESGKKLALQRHEFMLAFIDQLKIETSEEK